MGTDLKKYIYMTQNWKCANNAACSRPRRSASDVRDRFADYFVCREVSSITVANQQTLILSY